MTMKSDLQLDFPKNSIKQVRDILKEYSIVDRINVGTCRGKHGVTYPEYRTVSVFFKPFWQLPPKEEVNRQMFEMQNLIYDPDIKKLKFIKPSLCEILK